MKTSCIFALLCWASLSFARTEATFTLNGTITDAATGETLIGVTVRAGNGTGAVSNEYGFYSLTLPEGTHTLSFACLGYLTVVRELSVSRNQQLDMALHDNSTVLVEVEIRAQQQDEQVEQAQMGVEKINMAGLKSLPVLLGERDVLKTIQLLPGV